MSLQAFLVGTFFIFYYLIILTISLSYTTTILQSRFFCSTKAYLAVVNNITTNNRNI